MTSSNGTYDPASHRETECRLGGCVGCESDAYRAGYDWVLSNVYATAYGPDGPVVVTNYSRTRSVALTYEDGKLLINGQPADVGDDLPLYLGLIDEVTDLGTGEHYLADPTGEAPYVRP